MPKHRRMSEIRTRRFWTDILALSWSVAFVALGFTRGEPSIGVLGSLGIVLMLVLLRRRWRQPDAGD